MSIELVTGHAGEAHVTSAQDGRLNAAAWGGGKYVLPLQSQFAITVDSANQVTVATGDALLEGRHITSEAPTTLAVDSGTQGMKRYDLVAIVYEKDSSGVESASLTIIKGTETSGTPTDPDIPSGSILAGDTTCAMALWRLPIDGIALGDPVRLFTAISLLAKDDNATYTLGYTAASRALRLTGANGGASSSVVLPNATTSVPGLMSAADKTALEAAKVVTSGTRDTSGKGVMGFGYQNASKAWYLYFPVNAVGKTNVSLNNATSIDLRGNGTTHTINGPKVAASSVRLVNGGALVEMSITDTAVSSIGASNMCTAWSELYFSFS